MEILLHLADIDLAQGHPEHAENRYRETVEFIRLFQEAPRADLAEAYRGLGRSLVDLGRPDEAEEAFQMADGLQKS